MLQCKHRNFLIVLLLFAIIYSMLSLVNHYLFRTFALDLGAYTNALYDYVHFQFNDSRVFKPVSENLLADHFDIYLILFSPFSLLFGTYTLLIIQILAILFGGWGVYKYFSSEEFRSSIAISAVIWYFSFFGVFTALAFDYHSNVVAATLVPWFFYAIKKRKIGWSFLVMIFILISKENIPLWMAFISLGLVFEYWKDIKIRNTLLGFFLFSAFYFVLVTGFIMPAFANNNSYPHFHYSFLGTNAKEALVFLLSHPLESIQTLFVNHIGDPDADFIKLEFYSYLLISGFFLLFKKPQYILMLIPIFFQKMFHDKYIIWSTNGQYSIEFAVIMVFGIFMIINEIKSDKWRKILLYSIVIANVGITFRVMDNPIVHLGRAQIRIYKADHYSRDFDVKAMHYEVNKIPKTAIISAQSPFVPHLSLRDHIYQFPMIDNAEYIIFSLEESPYPLSDEEFLSKVNKLSSSEKWELEYEEGPIRILKKKK